MAGGRVKPRAPGVRESGRHAPRLLPGPLRPRRPLPIPRRCRRRRLARCRSRRPLQPLRSPLRAAPEPSPLPPVRRPRPRAASARRLSPPRHCRVFELLAQPAGPARYFWRSRPGRHGTRVYCCRRGERLLQPRRHARGATRAGQPAASRRRRCRRRRRCAVTVQLRLRVQRRRGEEPLEHGAVAAIT